MDVSRCGRFLGNRPARGSDSAAGPVVRKRRFEHTERGYQRMLVLSRRRDESIVIDDDIEITVLEVAGNKVRLGVTAPGRRIDRKEIWAAKQRQGTLSQRSLARMR